MGKTNKAKAMKYTKNELNEIIKQKKKEFYETQKAYRIKFKQRMLKQIELKHMQVQEKMGEKNIQMQWYGMQMPIDILRASYNLGIESYASLINEEKELYEILSKKYKLTEEEIKGIIEGKIIQEVKDEAKQE